MLVLGIESSCDETSCSIVKDGRTILSNIVATQIQYFKDYHGVVPEIASRKHIEWILPVVKTALRTAKLSLDDIDAVAATSEPGLIGGLLVGLTFAKTLAWTRGLPFIAINHMLGHLYAANLIDSTMEDSNPVPQYPYLGLLVSGGHSIICRVKGFDDIEVLGTTIDDSVGEAFDKVSNYLGLGYPGGPVIDRIATKGDIHAYAFPIATLDNDKHRYDMSYSGLKTAVIHQSSLFLQKGYEATKENIVASFQEAALQTLVRKLFLAVKDTGLTTVVAGGGVAANTRLRAILAEHKELKCIFPPLKLCGDNAAMIAGVAYHYLMRGDRSPLDTVANSRISSFKHRGLREGKVCD